MDNAAPLPPPSDCYRSASDVVRPVRPSPKISDTAVGRADYGALYDTYSSAYGDNSDGVTYY